MIKVYDGQRCTFLTAEQFSDKASLQRSFWIDLQAPTTEEIQFVEQRLGLDIPTADDMREIETSSRLYQENGAYFLTATVIYQADTEEPKSTPVTFILAGTRLITLRHEDPSPFRRMALLAEKSPAILHEPVHFFAELLDAFVDRLADLLERTAAQLDDNSQKIFATGKKERRADGYFQAQLISLGRSADLIARIRESVMSLTRLTNYFAETERVASSEHKERLNGLKADLFSIADHANFVNGKIQFLLDAVLGLVSIEQNRIIKSLSVAAAVFLPPTLIASMYGMNFDLMPELHWRWGYPIAIGMMVLSAVLPYFWLRKRSWI